MNEQIGMEHGRGTLRWIMGVAIIVVIAGALLVLYLAFRGAPGPVAASSAGAPADVNAPRETGAASQLIAVPSDSSRPATHPDDPDVDEGDLGHLTRSGYYNLPYPEEIARKTHAMEPLVDMFMGRRGTLTPAQRDRYNELHIVPWNPVVGQDCSASPGHELPPGVRYCKPISERQVDHPYRLLSTEQLRAMEDDPAAILLLARRDDEIPLTKEERFVEYTKAAALADKPGELLLFAYGAMLHRPGVEAKLDSRRTRYVIETVTHAMGDERSQPDSRRNEYVETLLEHGDDPDAALAAAEAESKRLLDEMNQTRLRVMGLPITLIEKEKENDD